MSWFDRITYVPSISEIAFASLLGAGVRGLIVDLDNTLVGHRGVHPDVREADWIAGALERNFEIVMLTNNATPWASEMAQVFNIPIIANARKPLPGGFRRALERLNLPSESVTVIGDQLFTDVLGARMSGLSVILVGPLARHDPWNTLPLRLVERLLLRKFRNAPARAPKRSKRL